MNTRIISSFVLTSTAAMLAAGCMCPCTTVTTPSGRPFRVPKCVQQIKYSGNSFTIGDATIPIGQEKVTINGVEWNTKKLQDAGTAIQAMEQTRLRLCEESVTEVQVLKYDDYVVWDRRRQEIQEKLDQLAYLVVLNNPHAVERWIDKYFTEVTVLSEKTPADKSTKTKAEATEFKMIPNDTASVQEISAFLK